MKKSRGKKNRAGRVALYGMLTALAMIFSYIEMLLPIPVGIPGVKPGLANLVVFAALYRMTALDAFVISMARILLVGMTFGNMSAMIYSLSGGILSFLVMWFLKKRDLFTGTGVSIAGGVAHNIGQLAAAALVLESGAVFGYFPALLVSGAVTGALVGLIGGLIIMRLPGS